MKYIISMLLLLSTLQVIAQEWSTYQYQDKYSIAIPPSMELRKESDVYTQVVRDILGKQIGYQISSDNKTGLKGLTAQDRADWEKSYADKIKGLDANQVDRFYRNVKFKEKFGGKPNYEQLKVLSPEQRDSLYNAEYEKETPVRVTFQQADLSTNKHEYKTKYCRILIDYYTCEDEHVPCSGDKLELNEEYFANGVIAIQQDCESTKTPLMTIISNDTMTIADSPATKIIYRRQGYNGASPVIVAIYTIFNYDEYVRFTMAFREAEQDIWMKDLVKARNSFRWMKQHQTSNTGNISKDDVIKEGLELGVLTAWKVILEVILGCCFLGFIIKTKKDGEVKATASVSEIPIDVTKEPLHLKQDRVYKTDIKKRLWRISRKPLLSLIIIIGSCVICGLMGTYGYTLNCLFYFPFYFIIGVYYLYIIWRKKELHSEDIVLYPLLKKIGIYCNISDHYLLRRYLLISVVPLLLVTVLVSLLVVSIDSISPDDYGEVSIGSFILSLPVIAWIVFFVYVYGKKWLDNTPKL